MPRSTNPAVMDRHDLKALLARRGLTLTDVSRLCEPPVSFQAVSGVLTGVVTSERIEATLALCSGLSLAQVQQVTRSGARERRFRQAA